MKQLISLFVFSMIFSVGMISLSYAAADRATSTPQTVIGDLLKIDGEFYVVKDMTGKEIRLHVDKTTTQDGAIKVATRSKPRPRKKTKQRLLNTSHRRCRPWDTKIEVQTQRLGQSVVSQICLRAGSWYMTEVFLHLTEEGFMVSIPKIVGLMSCGFLLCVGLSSTAQASNEPAASDVMKTDSQSDRTGFKENTIKGELVRVEGENYFVKGKDSKEVRLHVDKTTQLGGNFKAGDQIEVLHTEKDHAVSIKHAPSTK